MKVLIAEELTRYQTRALNELGVSIIQYISDHPGQRTIQFEEAIRRVVPGDDQDALVDDFTDRILEWFIARGDVYRGSRGRLYAFPPHAVQRTDKIFLYGRYLGEEWFRALEPSLSLVEEKSAIDRTVTATVGPFGLTRWIDLTVAGARGCSAIQHQGIPVVSLGQLREQLPTVEGLNVPVTREPKSLPAGGVWSIYTPEVGHSQGERWRVDWNGSDPGLLRWAPEDNARVRQFRHFLKTTAGRFLELGGYEMQLWQFVVDKERGIPLRVVLSDAQETLSVPGTLPTDFGFWLQNMSGSPVVREWGKSLFKVPASSHDEVAEILFDNLGVTCQRGE